MNIIIIGFMGVGKSEVGKALAGRLKLNFLDTDELIEKTEGRKIAEIFAQEGEDHFREMETEVLKTLTDYDHFVLSTGGGIVLREENVQLLKEIGPLVLLFAREEIILQRVKDTEDRPLLAGDKAQKINEILTVRNPIYNRVADFTVDTSEITPEAAADKIIEYVKSKG